MAPPERLDVTHDELAGILEQVRDTLPPAEFTKLEAAIRTLAWLTAQLEHKRVSVARLKQIIFGATTEKTQQVVSKALAEADAQADQATADTAPAAPTPRRRGHGRNGAAAYTGAERVSVAHPTLQPKAPCPECDGGKVYRVKRPQVLVRVRGQAPLMATIYERETYRCHLCGTLFPAPAPDGVGAHKYDATAGAMIALLKYGSGLPFNRLQGLEGQCGIPLPAPTQWDIVAATANQVQPVHDALWRAAAQGAVLHNDDTTMKILERMGKRGQRRALAEGNSRQARAVFTSGIVSVPDPAGDRRAAVFATGPRHAGENLDAVLERRDPAAPIPIQMCDALSRNLPTELQTLVANCLAHGRRKFVEVVGQFPEACAHVLTQLGIVYRLDAQAQQQDLDPDARLAWHQAHSAPVMAELHAWFATQFNERHVEPNSTLGEAISYMQKHWNALTQFLHTPGAPLDNNVCERALKKAILHRKNSLFYRSARGAKVGDCFMSLIYTAELNDVNPFDYLTALQLHAAAVAADPDAWLPWNYAATRAALDGDAAPA